MGLEWLERVAPSFKKKWDRARVTLATADLFTQRPIEAARTAVAEISEGRQVKEGDRLNVEVSGCELVATSGNAEIARFRNPPPDLVRAVEASCGIASGTVVQVHATAGVAEIAIC